MCKLNIIERFRIWWRTGKRAKYIKIMKIEREIVASLLDRNGNAI